MKLNQLNQFLQGYLTSAFWTNDNTPGSGDYAESDRPETNFDLLPESELLKAVRDCRKFQDQNENLLRLAGQNDFQDGHNFWLTRNRHGAGFWDGDYSDQGEALTESARKFGETDLYKGDDGKWYFSR